MVSKKELNDFKQTLTSALQKYGYTAYGRISSSEDTYNAYAHLPEQEMVSAYVEDNNLDEVNRVYRIIKFIDDNSGNRYSLKTLCEDNGVDYKVFNHAVENMPYIDKTGVKRNTQYRWIHEQEPSFKTAKDIVDHMRKLKVTKLNRSIRKKISQAVAKGISKEDFFKENNIKKDATYNAEAYFTYKKAQLRKNEDSISEPVQENISEPEASPVDSETELQSPENAVTEPERTFTESESAYSEPVVTDEEKIQTSEITDDAGLEMENYILKHEIKYLKRINKAKDKLIEALRERR